MNTAKAPMYLVHALEASQNINTNANETFKKDGIRAENSEIPNNDIETAPCQNDKGGFAQNGTPSSSCGVNQLPLVSITRAISPYLASVVSANG